MPSLQSFFFRLCLKYLKATTDWNAPVEKLRASIEKGARLTRLPKNVDVQRIMAVGVPAEWLHPSRADPRKVILYLHGGGYAVGSCNSHRALAARIARAGQADALLLDYRLAPESPYPAAIEDSIAAYHWLLRNHYLPQNIILVGDSAGGGLAIATLVSLRDNGASLPAAAVCISPLTDAEGTGESVMSNAKADPLLKPEAKALFRHYVGNNSPRLPLISPIYADLRGLPPLLIHVGQNEILLSDSTRLADKARAAGVDVTLKVWGGMWHVFHFFAPPLPEAREAIKAIGEFVQQQVNRRHAAEQSAATDRATASQEV